MQQKAQVNPFPSPEQVREGLMQPLWIDRTLVLARRVSVNGRAYVQGCWLDWSALQGSLAAEVEDLLPRAELVPVPSGASADPSRLLASLPVQLVPGPVAVELARSRWPVRLSLAIAWRAYWWRRVRWQCCWSA